MTHYQALQVARHHYRTLAIFETQIRGLLGAYRAVPQPGTEQFLADLEGIVAALDDQRKNIPTGEDA